MRARVILRELRTQSRRYLLVAVSMLLGVAGVTGVALVDSVVADMLVARQEQLNGRFAMYEAALARSPEMSAASRLDAIEDAFIEIRDSLPPQTRSVAVDLDSVMSFGGEGTVERGADGDSIPVTWTLGDRTEIRRTSVIAGAADAGCYPRGLLLNTPAAHELGVSVSSEVYVVTGAARPPARMSVRGLLADGLNDAHAYGAWETLRCMAPESMADADITVRVVAPPPDGSAIGSLLQQAFTRQGLEFETVPRRMDTVDEVLSEVMVLSRVFAGFAVLLLLVAGLGITNVGVSAIRERARELAIRRAFGATRMNVFVQVLSGVVLVGSIVGGAVIVITVIATFVVVPAVIPEESAISPPQFPVLACALALLAALGVSVVGSVAPAIQATRLPISRALRE